MFRSIKMTMMCGALIIGLARPVLAGEDGPIIVVSGPLSWSFFAAMKQGFDDAAQKFGVKYEYMAVTDTANMTSDYPRLLQQAIGRDPSMLLVGEFFPDGMDPLVKEATAAKIPVLLHNSGQALWKANGSMGFIGEDPYQMGYVAGERHAAQGVKKGLCFNQVPGNPTVEARCTGYIDAMKAAKRETVLHTIGTGDATNPEALLQALKGILNADQSIDGVHTLGFQVALAAVKAADDLGKKGKIYISSTDVSTELLTSIKAGDVAFTMDQQPYLQGFLSIQIAAQYLQYGLHPVGQIVTGPLVISKDNVDKVIEVNKLHPGILGAS